VDIVTKLIEFINVCDEELRSRDSNKPKTIGHINLYGNYWLEHYNEESDNNFWKEHPERKRVAILYIRDLIPSLRNKEFYEFDDVINEIYKLIKRGVMSPHKLDYIIDSIRDKGEYNDI
jgi:hypothetical protein